ncbi:response regulator transcription factor [Novosphingobium album (ex Liu et al. 2023)]|uniref:Helix-turn-helix transcriptional regulator n=1 Tax=Novosphingobium album (ex Liu et al. 2023) TaxID=3031130 RepID=A0ABT5WMS8_9SPHN|nr:helix-turn-helix transcriptional regulator [Novosphingobium album (ex Liu et al. 2023)]MDE8651351.1 helix-turn-helix transcriptional regulator [Novosphingobium album (ex Liu et al. 2023)]
MPGDLTAIQSLGSLTDKQREVLDLLIEHKTSKEISRELGISPHTVDQRLDTVRAKLGARNRSEIAQIYRRLRLAETGAQAGEPAGEAISERLTHEKTHMAPPAFFANGSDRNDEDLPPQDQGEPDRADPGTDAETVRDYRVVPELFDGEYGTQARLLAIVLIAAAFLVTALTGFSIVKSVSDALQG